MGLKTLLRDLRAFGVVRYRKDKDGSVELVFAGAPPELLPDHVPEGEERHPAAVQRRNETEPPKVDPLALGTREFPPIEGDEELEN